MSYLDSHAHLMADELFHDLSFLIERAKKENVEKVINICTDKKTLDRAFSCSFHDFLFHAAATTPHDVEKEGEFFFPFVEKAAKEKKLCAIGETGLDYYYEHSPKEVQKKFLRKYLQLSIQENLPVIIHCRDAFSDFFSILDKERKEKTLQGVLHCFTGNLEEAKEVIKRDFYISFSGIITFKKSEDLRQAVKEMPLEKILIETDSPYLAPQKYRGKRNEPSFVPLVAKCIAEVKEMKVDEVAAMTTQNAKTLFRL